MLFKTTKFLIDKTWLIVVLIVVFVTIYAVAGRQLVQKAPDYRIQLEEALEERSGIDVQIDDMRGKWTVFTPVIELSKVSFVQPSTGELIFSARKIALEVDVLSSLVVRELRLRRVVVGGFSAILDDELLKLSNDADDEKADSGSKKVSLASGEIKKNKETSLKNIVLAKMIFRQRNIQLQDSTVTFHKQGKPARIFTNINAQFQNIAGKHTLSGKLHLGAGRQLLEFSANANGFPLDKNTRIQLYGNLHHGDVLRWLPEDIQEKLSLKGLKINGLLLGSQLWVTWHKGYLENIIGKINAEEIALVTREIPESSNEKNKKTGDKAKQSALPPFRKVSVLYSVAPLKPESFNQGFKINLSDLEFEWNNFIWNKSEFLVDLDLPSKIDPLKFTLNASEIDLEPIASFLLESNTLPIKTREILNELNPSGKLKDVSFKYNAFNKIKFNLDARLKNIAIREWEGVPGIRNLSANLSMTNRSGHLQLNSRNTKFKTSRHLRQSINVARLTGPVKWEITKRKNKKSGVSLKSGILLLENHDLKGKLMLSVSSPDEEPFPHLSLMADIENARAEKISFYLPPIIPDGALNWLDSGIVSGKAKGAIVYHGPVGSGAMTDYNHSLQSQVFVDSADIDFDPGNWPKIKNSSGNIFILNGLVDFDFSRGNIFDALASNIIGHVGPSGKDLIWQLELSGHIAGNTSDGLRILQESILKETLNDVANQWVGKGKLETQLELTLPLEGIDVDNPQVNVDITLKESEINMRDFDLIFSDVNGTLNYTNESGLTSSSLKTKLFSYDAIVDMLPMNQKSHEMFRLSVKSRVDAKSLYDWAKQPLLAFMEGETAYIADLKVLDKPGEGVYTELSVDSNLAGVKINMPSVFNKPKEIVSPLLFNMKWKGDDSYLFLGRQNVFNSLLMFNNDELIKGELVIGDRLASLPDDNRLYADGFLDKLLWPEWEQFFDALELEYLNMELTENNYNQTGDAENDDMDKFLDSIGGINLRVNYFEGFGMELDNVVSKITREGPAWLVQSKNEMLSGFVKVPDGDDPLDIELDYLYLPDEEVPHVDIVDYKPLVEESPVEFPALNARIKDFKYGKKDFGSWEVIAYPKDHFYRIERLKIQIGDLIFKGQGQWVDGEPFSKTTLTGSFNTRDIGDLMESWGYPVTIESKSGSMSYVISWPYSPLDFDTDFLEGMVHLKLKDGRFLEVEGPASAVRIMGIMNFSTLGRRLKLDFNDLFKSGLSYDRIKGPIKIENGNMFLKDFEIRGPSTFIEAQGKLDYINETVDMDLEVSLPFSNNLIPLVALVAGPLAGGGWFVADRLFGDKINKVFKMNYKVSNTFENPKVELKSRLLN